MAHLRAFFLITHFNGNREIVEVPKEDIPHLVTLHPENPPGDYRLFGLVLKGNVLHAALVGGSGIESQYITNDTIYRDIRYNMGQDIGSVELVKNRPDHNDFIRAIQRKLTNTPPQLSLVGS